MTKSSRPTKSTHRNSSSSRRTKRSRTTTSSSSDVPDDVRNKIQRVLDDACQSTSLSLLLQNIKHPHDNKNDDDNNNDAVVLRTWRDDVLARQLDLPHIPLKDIRRALQLSDDDDYPAHPTKLQQQRLQQLAVDAYRQNIKVQQVFSLLDPAGKGCIMLQDLQRAVHELELDSSSNNTNDGEDWSGTALEEMMTLFAGSASGGGMEGEDEDDASSILLLPDDLLRIARELNL